MKKDYLEDSFSQSGSTDAPKQMSTPSAYLTPSGSAYPSEPILTSKASGWVGVFGDHYLCEAGCKKYVSKKLDDVIKFFEREIRLWYKAKELAKKGKLDVEVKGHVRKPRKKKDAEPDDHEEHIKANIEYAEKLGLDKPKKRFNAEFINEPVIDDDQVEVSDKVEEGKVLFVKDENIKVKDG